MWASVERAGEISFQSQRDVLSQHRLESVQAPWESVDCLFVQSNMFIRGIMIPCCNTKLRISGQSPTILPRAQITCSFIPTLPLKNRLISTASASITRNVCSLVPDKAFVITHEDSSCKKELGDVKNLTNLGTIPDSIISLIDGEVFLERNHLIMHTSPYCPKAPFELIGLVTQMNSAYFCSLSKEGPRIVYSLLKPSSLRL